MKRLVSILIALIVFFIFGCNNGLSKSDVQKMINEAKQNTTDSSSNNGTTPSTENVSSISQIFETALNEVCGKTWKSERNENEAGKKRRLGKSRFRP